MVACCVERPLLLCSAIGNERKQSDSFSSASSSYIFAIKKPKRNQIVYWNDIISPKSKHIQA